MNVGLSNPMMTRAVSLGANAPTATSARGLDERRSSLGDSLASKPANENKKQDEFADHIEQAKRVPAKSVREASAQPAKKASPFAKSVERKSERSEERDETTSAMTMAPGLVQQAPVRAPEAKPEVEDESDVEEVESFDRMSGKEFAQPKLQQDPFKKAELGLIGKLRDSQVSEKRSAMEEFLTKMKDRFGIEPQTIVNAFAKMDGETLTGSPEEATKAFASSFNLPAADEKKVASLYRDMVQTTGQADLNEKVLDRALMNEEAADADPADEAMDQLAHALDKIENAFTQKTPVIAQLDDRAKAQRAAEQMQFQIARLAQTGGDTKAVDADDESDDSVDAFASNSQFPKSSQNAMTSEQEPRLDLAKNMANGQGGQNAGGSMNGQSQNSSKEFARALNSEKRATTSKVGETKVEAKPTLNTDAAAANNAQTAPAESDLAAGPTLKVAGPKMAPADESANAKEILKNAQVLVKKGGGEMKMDLKPEGVGSVHLKVTVENGQVNVQFMAENESAKRLLEKNMHDLKSGLAAHDLKLDALKIDVAQTEQKNSSMDQNRDDQNARQQVQQFAQDVMGQFRDERQGFQQGFMENPGWKQYGRQPSRVSANPENVAQSASVANSLARSRAMGSSRLNLVA